MNIGKTFKEVIKKKNAVLYLIGCIAGIIIAWVSSSIMQPGQARTLVCLGGAVISIICGNAFSQLIAIVQMTQSEEDKK